MSYYLERVRRGVDFIEARLDEDIALCDVAKAAGISHTVNYAYSTWRARSGRRHSYAPDLGTYGVDDHPTREQSVLYYGIPLS